MTINVLGFCCCLKFRAFKTLHSVFCCCLFPNISMHGCLNVELHATNKTYAISLEQRSLCLKLNKCHVSVRIAELTRKFMFLFMWSFQK